MNQGFDTSKKQLYGKLTPSQVTTLHKYFNYNYLTLLNVEVEKLVEGRDLDVSDKSFYEILDFNNALLLAPTHTGRVYIGITEEKYQTLLRNKGKEVSIKTFPFGYTTVDKTWKRYLVFLSKSAVSKKWLHIEKEGLIDFIFPKDSTFMVYIENDVLTLKEI